MSQFLIWNESESQANDILRDLMRQSKYKWVWRKLNSARFHLIESHTQKIVDVEWTDQFVVTNGDASA